MLRVEKAPEVGRTPWEARRLVTVALRIRVAELVELMWVPVERMRAPVEPEPVELMSAPVGAEPVESHKVRGEWGQVVIRGAAELEIPGELAARAMMSHRAVRTRSGFADLWETILAARAR